MRLWWRRNGIPVAIIAVLLPATVFITFSTEWATYNTTRAVEPVVVDRGDTVAFGGADWAVLNSERIAGGSAEGIDAELPAGADLVVVTFLVTPGEPDDEGKSPYCMFRLQELDGSDVSRTFGDAALDPISHKTNPTAVASCTTDNLDPYRVESTFVVPADTGDTLAVKLEVESELPRFLQLTL
ncbi:MAG: hypothetical protein JWQ43_2142 [Glaciihabitans sp.]|nr:hypothetical protein [Glaciihabitans sp.]